MSYNVTNAEGETWRNTERITIGPGKGRFKKKSLSVQKEKQESAKTLCNEEKTDNTPIDANKNVLSGREIHEPSILAQEMWCAKCDIPLSFRFAHSKEQHGLGYVYDIKCYQCLTIKRVRTGKVFREDINSKQDLFVVNAKAAVCVLDAGIGETQLNLLLSAMNVSTVSDTLLKRYERIMGPYIEEVTMESCCEALEEELAMAKEANDIILDE